MTLATAAASNGPSAALGAVVLIAGVILYFVPIIVGVIRHVRHLGAVAVVNIFLGWTMIGWVVALAMACRSKDPQPMATTAPPTA